MKWITFVGEGRSGHTILSAILDSHPHVRMAEEQKLITKWWRDGWAPEKILTEAKRCGHGKERKLKALPGALTWAEPLMAVGDKCGWDSVMLMKKQKAPANIIEEFGNYMGMDVKVIHSIRDPLENISAWVDSPKYKRSWPVDYYRARMCIRRYARFYSTASLILASCSHFNLHNEELCEIPEEVLTRLCGYLELPVTEPWLTNASKAVSNSPHRRSDAIDWDPELKEMVQWRIVNLYDFFGRYKR